MLQNDVSDCACLKSPDISDPTYVPSDVVRVESVEVHQYELAYATFGQFHGTETPTATQADNTYGFPLQIIRFEDALDSAVEV